MEDLLEETSDEIVDVREDHIAQTIELHLTPCAQVEVRAKGITVYYCNKYIVYTE